MKQKRKPNRSHIRTKPTVSEPIRPLRVSIITSPKSQSDGPVLHRDVELVKAALLYADEVELVSPGAAMLGSVAGLAEGGIPALIELFGSFDDETLGYLNQGKPMPDNFREMLPLLPLLMDQDVAKLTGIEDDVKGFSSELEEVQAQLAELAESLISGAGADELIPALESGFLTLDTAGAAGTCGVTERCVIAPRMTLSARDDARRRVTPGGHRRSRDRLPDTAGRVEHLVVSTTATGTISNRTSSPISATTITNVMRIMMKTTMLRSLISSRSSSLTSSSTSSRSST